MTLDAMALDLMLKGNSTQLTLLAERVQSLLEGLAECPECTDLGPHEDNGCHYGSGDFNLCCRRCGTQFEPKC